MNEGRPVCIKYISVYIRKVLDEAAAAVAAGVTTDEIDRVVHEATVDRYFMHV